MDASPAVTAGLAKAYSATQAKNAPLYCSMNYQGSAHGVTVIELDIFTPVDNAMSYYVVADFWGTAGAIRYQYIKPYLWGPAVHDSCTVGPDGTISQP
jgi:hypothetical protein